MEVTKRSGERVKYIAKKLRKSLMRSGASGKLVKKIISQIEASLYPGIPTKEIYKKAFSLLRKEHNATAAKYKLKNAILELGPSGFPFENYVGHLLQDEDYATQIGIIVKGKCVDHEVDIIATKPKEVNYIECKFHNKSSFSCNVKTPLYIRSRFEDIQAHNQQKTIQKQYAFWIITNTKFTSEAIAYATCTGIKLISWNYPSNNNLRHRIDRTGMHPLTCLTTLTKKEKHQLLKNETILCRQIMNDPSPLQNVGISQSRILKIMGEAKALFELKNA
ncbi:MAG: restriction endonuclease [Saprospiraceae bacterium]|nr:restriction endonuclease [Saprospiraceae bacterium]